MFKNIIPTTLIGRAIIIIFVPIIILVLVTSLIFYQTSWNIISKRLAESVVADINVIVKLIEDDLEIYAKEIEVDFVVKAMVDCLNEQIDNIRSDDFNFLNSKLMKEPNEEIIKKLKKIYEEEYEKRKSDLKNEKKKIPYAIPATNPNLIAIFIAGAIVAE